MRPDPRMSLSSNPPTQDDINHALAVRARIHLAKASAQEGGKTREVSSGVGNGGDNSGDDDDEENYDYCDLSSETT